MILAEESVRKEIHRTLLYKQLRAQGMPVAEIESQLRAKGFDDGQSLSIDDDLQRICDTRGSFAAMQELLRRKQAEGGES